MSTKDKDLSTNFHSPTKKIGDLACIDRTRTKVQDESSAIMNAEMTILDACRLMISSDCKEAFILHNNSIIGLINRDELFKTAILEISDIHFALQDMKHHVERSVELQASLQTEIRSHLNAIHTGLSSLSKPPQDLSMIHAITLSASAIKDTLSTFEKSQIQMTPSSHTQEVVTINQFLTQIVTLVQAEAEARGVTISFAPRMDYRITLHRATLSQALRAILDDMIRSFGPGTQIQINSRCHFQKNPGEAHISIRVQQGEVLHSYGIDRAGTLMSGLAHTLVREAVRMHGGRLDLNTDSDSSTVYEITMPGAEMIRASSQQHGPIKILIVEDDDEVLLLLKDIVTSRGYEVVLASDGETAMKHFLEQNPTLILADVRIPKMDGIQLTDKVKAINPNLPIILFSGQLPNLFEDFQQKRIKADHVLYKPFATNDILESLTLLLPG